MKKTLLFALASLITLCANAFTYGENVYEPWSVEQVEYCFPSNPIMVVGYYVNISDQAVTLVQCLNKDIKKAEIPSLALNEGNDYVVQYVMNSAFEECAELSEVVIGDSLKILPDLTFSSCPVKKLVWNAENCVIETDYVLSIFLDDSPVTWRDLRLQFEQVEDLIIGDNVKVLPNLFVAHSKISSVTIPKSVTSIYEFAFSGCFDLKSVHVQAQDPSLIEVAWRAFQETADHCTLYVPRGTAERYRQADPWKEFQNIVEEGEEEQPPYDLNHDGQVDITDVSILIDYILGK